MNNDDIKQTLQQARQSLLQQRTGQGFWQGKLAGSALSTATSTVALTVLDRESYGEYIRRGLAWLVQNRNEDGGWGDTVKSKSNLSTTMLCWTALSVDTVGADEFRTAAEGAAAWIAARVGTLEPERLAAAVISSYGNDRTFSAPILSLAAIGGRLGDSEKCWDHVAALPFELAVLPPAFYKRLRLQVVSYALPALIAVGLSRFIHSPPGNPLLRYIRGKSIKKCLSILSAIQPASGGYLEAAPLTGFVAMNLASAGFADHPVTRKCRDFLLGNMRQDGSWAIDVDLATWLTSLSVNALAAGGRLPEALSPPECTALQNWLLQQQTTTRHPYTNAEPGGWGWTNQSGSVPDADDTSGALLALKHLSAIRPITLEAIARAVDWLLSLQNSDGGVPTFCRGWQKLPFDRSGTDLTAHALAALNAWRDQLDTRRRHRIDKFNRRALAYLARTQRKDGAWVPLWFGNQDAQRQENPTYGTARVITALARAGEYTCLAAAEGLIIKGLHWLTDTQLADGGWNGDGNSTAPASIEETALAISALAQVSHNKSYHPPEKKRLSHALQRGLTWLTGTTARGSRFPPAPIGFYFANLWYYEKLYPLIFTVEALEKVNALDTQQI